MYTKRRGSPIQPNNSLVQLLYHVWVGVRQVQMAQRLVYIGRHVWRLNSQLAYYAEGQSEVRKAIGASSLEVLTPKSAL
jgi:hypothetical protein